MGYALVYLLGVASDIVLPLGAAALMGAYVLIGEVPAAYGGPATRRDRPVLFWLTIGGIACCFLVSLGAAVEGEPPSRWWTVVGVIIWIYAPIWGLIERDRRTAQ